MCDGISPGSGQLPVALAVLLGFPLSADDDLAFTFTVLTFPLAWKW